MFCYSESCSSPVWYKTLLYLRTIWLLVDYSSDILFLIEEIQGENFQVLETLPERLIMFIEMC